jgi:hypothetical protein
VLDTEQLRLRSSKHGMANAYTGHGKENEIMLDSIWDYDMMAKLERRILWQE